MTNQPQTPAERQRARRERVKRQGLVDLRIPVTVSERDALHIAAEQAGETLQAYARYALVKELAESGYAHPGDGLPPE